MVTLGQIDGSSHSSFFKFSERPRVGSLKPLFSSSYYSRLGVDSKASTQDITKAYRRKAQILHPDKGGNENDFKELVEAYETLSDPKKRSLYDRLGTTKGAPDSTFGSNFFREFRQFSAPLIIEVEVTLENLYNGKDFPLFIPNFPPLSVKITKGMRNGEEIVFKGLTAINKAEIKDIIVRLIEKSHPNFRRANADLFTTLSITPQESLFGFNRSIRCLTGQTIIIKSPLGEVVKDNDVFIVSGQGMPIYPLNSPPGQNKNGNLFVQVICKWPNKMWLTGSDAEILYDLLNTSRKSPISLSPSVIQKKVGGFWKGLTWGGGSPSSQSTETATSPTNGAIFLKRSTLDLYGKTGKPLPDPTSDDFTSFFFQQFFGR
jgi:DnaJ-class molecular chaperone